MSDKNYLQAEIIKLDLVKFDGRNRINLIPQAISLDIYQSLNYPLIVADLVIYDSVGLKFNYPLIGEEYIELEISQSDDQTAANKTIERKPIKLKFMVSSDSIKVIADTVREQTYTLRLYSAEMMENPKVNVQRAYKDSYDKIIQHILKGYLKTDKSKVSDDYFEETKDSGAFVVPGLYPLEAIAMCVKRAVPKEPDHNIMFFYENFRGFNFMSLGKLAKMGATRVLYLFGDSNFAQSSAPWAENKTITGITVGKEFSTLFKIAMGYFDNEYYGIDIHNKTKKVKATALSDTVKIGISGKGQMNSEKFIKAMHQDTDRIGQKGRTRYIVMQNGGDDPSQPTYFDEKIGSGIQEVVSMSESYITVTAPGYTKVNAGDIVKIELPEVHGFNEVEQDRYKSGDYLVMDIRHTFSLVDAKYFMTMNITKNALTRKIKEEMEYNVGSK